MIEITKDEERIKISFPYNPDYIAKIKTIEGYRWYPEEKCWSVPYFEFETFLSVFEGEKLGCFQEQEKRSTFQRGRFKLFLKMREKKLT